MAFANHPDPAAHDAAGLAHNLQRLAPDSDTSPEAHSLVPGAHAVRDVKVPGATAGSEALAVAGARESDAALMNPPPDPKLKPGQGPRPTPDFPGYKNN